ncbi:hypothetical protein WJX72_000701 [[Myrmecia] bisecta]|uniref:Uncharacterized protein n=1 Tax=[Myrmecia] bisecta TaxID=41462 RepID=A0AAW1R554_9CHLO
MALYRASQAWEVVHRGVVGQALRACFATLPAGRQTTPTSTRRSIDDPAKFACSMTDPVYDYMNAPYERTPKRTPQHTQQPLRYGYKAPSFNNNSFMDPVYDYMSTHYERPKHKPQS